MPFLSIPAARNGAADITSTRVMVDLVDVNGVIQNGWVNSSGELLFESVDETIDEDTTPLMVELVSTDEVAIGTGGCQSFYSITLIAAGNTTNYPQVYMPNGAGPYNLYDLVQLCNPSVPEFDISLLLEPDERAALDATVNPPTEANPIATYADMADAGSHTHSNLPTLNNVTDTGDGTEFLASDGTYKVPAGTAGGHTIQGDGTPFAAQPNLNFVGATVTNDVGNSATKVEGLKGDTGDTGAEGPTGSDGPAGARGAVGADGPAGPQGDTGATGAQGPQGIQGLQGPQGIQGADGADGLKGDTGDTGDQGVQGPVGPEGVAGSGVTIVGTGTWPTIEADVGATEGDMWILAEPHVDAPLRQDASPAEAGDGIAMVDAAWTNVGPIRGPAGPSTVSNDAGNSAVLGTDSFIYVPTVTAIQGATGF